jgi:hypothetical protein
VDELNVHSEVVELCERYIVDYETKFGFKKYLDVSEVVNDVHIRHLGARRKVQLVSPDSCSVGLVY